MRVGRHKVDLRNLRKVQRDVKHRWLGLPWMQPRPTDCFVASWPRSGNTWLRHMVFFYFNPGATATMDAVDQMIPNLDGVDFRSALNALPGPIRFIKTHERGASYFLTGKVVYIVRDGRDATYSWHHFRSKLYRETEDFDAFLSKCLGGKYRYGAWHDSVNSWLQFRHHPNMLILRYEDVLIDPAGALSGLLRFIGHDPDAGRVAHAVERSTPETVGSSFRSMVQARGAGFSGASGARWRDAYTPDQLSVFLSHAGRTLEALGY